MGHIIKYRMIQTTRKTSLMFWAFAFPIILGTLFYLSFGKGGMGEDMEAIPTAIVKEETSVYAEAFLEFLEQMDGTTIETVSMTDKEAKDALKDGQVTGIFYCRQEPGLTVAGSGINQSILKTLLDSYCRNAAMMQAAAEEHPERMAQAMEAMEQWQELTEETSIKGKTMDSNISYFFALIAYACLSGAFLGVQASFDGQANLSALGIRRSITPTHKFQLILTDFLVLFFIHFCNVGILTIYIRYVLGIRLGSDVPSIVLVELLGSMIGISLGMMLGCVSRLSVNAKMGLCVLFTLLPGFLAGLMFGQMKDIIEHHCPIINRLNPASVLSDAFYCIGVYDDSERLLRNLLLLGVMSAALVTVAYLAVRRERYDSV